MADVSWGKRVTWCVTGVIAGSSLVLGGGASSPASAQTADIAAFLAAPGVVRTEIPAQHIDVDETTGIVYAVLDDGVAGYDISDPLRPVLAVPSQGGSVDIDGFEVDDMDVAGEGSGLVVALDDRVYPVAVVGAGAAQRLNVGEPILVGEPTVSDLGINRRRVVAAPDASGRFITWTNWSDVVVHDRGELIAVDLGSDSFVPPLIFGETSDTILGRGRNESGEGELREVDWSTEPPAVIRSAPTTFWNTQSIARRGEQIWLDQRIHDATTLEYETEVAFEVSDFEEIFELDEVYDESGRPEFVYRVDRGGVSDEEAYVVVDGSDPAEPLIRVWEFPSRVRLADVVSLGDGLVATVESARRNDRLEGHLTIVDAELLSSNYGEYFPMRPTRVLDTRNGNGGPQEPVGPGASIDLDVAAAIPLDAVDVLGVVLNVTVPRPSANTYVTLWPAGSEQPFVSNLNVSAGRTLANMVTVPVGEGGAVSIYNHRGRSDVVVDLVGYYGGIDGPAGHRFKPSFGGRVLDTREFGGRIRRGQTITVQIEGDGFGEDIVAAVVNLTAVQPSAAGFVTTWAAGESRPLASTLNVEARQNRANLAVVPVSASDEIAIFNGAGETDMVVDLMGWYLEPGSAERQQGRYLPTAPFRAFDSRADPVFPGTGRLTPGDGLILSSSNEYVDLVNIAAIRPDRAGFMSVVSRVDRSRSEPPRTSTVNFAAGETAANAAYATGAPNYAVLNPVANAHLVVDVFGYLTPQFLRPLEDVWPREG